MKNARESIGSPGGSSSGIIIPMGQEVSNTRFFPHILDAISQIQQFYVIESSGQEIPDDFLTIRSRLNFFNVGFGAGFLEALVFAILMTLILILISDDHTRQAIARYFPPINSDVFLWTVNLLPVGISGCLCSYLSRCYIGKITRKAIDSLLLGRVFSMTLKGLIIFFVMIFLSNHINTHSAWTIATWVSLKKYHIARIVYYTLMAMKPMLIERAFEVLVVFCLAIIMPFLFIWGVAWVRKIKTHHDRTLMEI